MAFSAYGDHVHVSNFNNTHNLYSLSGRGVFFCSWNTFHLNWVQIWIKICKPLVNLHPKSNEFIQTSWAELVQQVITFIAVTFWPLTHGHRCRCFIYSVGGCESEFDDESKILFTSAPLVPPETWRSLLSDLYSHVKATEDDCLTACGVWRCEVAWSHKSRGRNIVSQILLILIQIGSTEQSIWKTEQTMRSRHEIKVPGNVGGKRG